jgi:hypothetical protein
VTEVRVDLIEALLDRELEVCEPEELSRRGARLWREGTEVFLAFDAGRNAQRGLFKLDCATFDAEPPSVIMIDPDSRADLPLEQWVPGVPHSIHPTLNRPFVCIQGVLEYHQHPSHLDDSWDKYRPVVRLPQTVRRLLEKAGVP